MPDDFGAGLTFAPGFEIMVPLGADGDDRKGQHSIRSNQQWRVCFVWTAEGATDVEIADYH